MTPSFVCRHPHACRLVAVGIAICLLSGCSVPAWFAQGVTGSMTKKTEHSAEYAGLANKTVAVLVSADEQTLYRFPNSQRAVCRTISSQLATAFPGQIQVVDPDQVMDFLDANPFWIATPYGDLLQRLNVQRLVIIDLVEYSTHEPGNAHLWRGVIVGNVGVAEAESLSPGELAYSNTVRVEFPPDTQVGLTDSDDETIELGVRLMFGERVANLFRDHTTEESYR